MAFLSDIENRHVRNGTGGIFVLGGERLHKAPSYYKFYDSKYPVLFHKNSSEYPVIKHFLPICWRGQVHILS